MADSYHVTPKGYRRNNRSGRFEHVEAWERYHGRAVPDGMQVHHLDGDKLNNDPGNLLACDPTTHKRLHSGCVLRGDSWWKPCGICGTHKPVGADDWYLSRQGWPLYGRCRPCHIQRVVSDKRLRKLRNAAAT